jgi:signal transduction histidine kinase
MSRSRVLVAAAVLAGVICTAIVVISPRSPSPLYSYVAAPSLLVLDLTAAAAIASSCAAAGLLGRPPLAVIGCGLSGSALLADAWLGANLSSTLQALGFAAVPLLPATLALAPRAAGVRRSRASRLATNAVVAAATSAAVASVALYDPYADVSCLRDCLPNPLLLLDAPAIVTVLYLVEGVAAGAWCLLAIHDLVRDHSPALTLASTVAVGLATVRLVAFTFVQDDPQREALAVLHAGAAGGVLLTAAGIAYELSRAPRARARLAELMRDLRTAEESGVEYCLQRATGDDRLTLGYRHPTAGRLLIDARGREVGLSHAPEHAHTEIRIAGETVAVIDHRAGSVAASALSTALGPAAALALDNERLRAATLHELARRRAAASKLIEVSDAERTRIERNLHDGAQQGLVATGLALRLTGLQHPDPAIDEALDELGQIMATVRSIAHGIHPTVLAAEGLAAAIESLADDTPGLAVGLHLDPGIDDLPEAVEISAYEMLTEALRNGADHAARSITIDARLLDGELQVTVGDDGSGGASLKAGHALEGVHDRALALGGTLEISSPKGGPTRLAFRIPSHQPSSRTAPTPSSPNSAQTECTV